MGHMLQILKHERSFRMTQQQRFSPGERVFAKVKGFVPWPAMVRERLPGKKAEIYKVYFYGSYDMANVRADQLYVYNEDNLAKYGKNAHTKKLFSLALKEIAENVEIQDRPTKAEQAVTSVVEELIAENIEALTAEINMKENGTPVILKSPSPLLQAHVELEKVHVKQLIRSAKSITREYLGPTILNPTSSAGFGVGIKPKPMISRSGRVIKPKRFADDYRPSSAFKLKNRILSSPGSSKGVSCNSSKCSSSSALRDAKNLKEVEGVKPANDPVCSYATETSCQTGRSFAIERPKFNLKSESDEDYIRRPDLEGYPNGVHWGQTKRPPTLVFDNIKKASDTQFSPAVLNADAQEFTSDEEDGMDEEDMVFMLLWSLNLLDPSTTQPS